MALKRINRDLSDNPRYRKYQKPMLAAEVCEAARAVAGDRFNVISYQNGLLTVAVESSAAAGNLQAESGEIIEKINKKIGEQKVVRIRFKIG